MEGLIEEEVQALNALLETKKAEAFDIAPILNLPILNALWKVTVGERFEYEDPKLLDICERLGKVFKINFSAKMGMIFSYPWLLKLPKWLFDYSFVMNLFHDVIDMMQANVMKHQQTLDPQCMSFSQNLLCKCPPHVPLCSYLVCLFLPE